MFIQPCSPQPIEQPMSGDATYLNPNYRGGRNHHRDCSGKFKFVHCLETYLKRLISLGHEGTLSGPFLQRVPRN